MIRVNFVLELIKWWYSCIRVIIGHESHDGFCDSSSRGNGRVIEYRASVHNESLTSRDDYIRLAIRFYETLHLFQKLCLHKEQCLLLKRSSKSNFGTTVGNCLLDDILVCAYRTVSTQQDRFERSKWKLISLLSVWTFSTYFLSKVSRVHALNSQHQPTVGIQRDETL